VKDISFFAGSNRLGNTATLIVATFYLFLLLSDISHEDLDKTPVIVAGLVGWIVLLIRARLPVDPISLSFLAFCLYMLLTVPLYPDPIMALNYASLFLLLFGLFLVFRLLLRSERNYHAILRSLIILQSLVSLIGIIDFFLFEFGTISPIRDYTSANKADSFFANPNPLGITSALCFCLSQTRGLLRTKYRLLVGACLLAGVLVSQSTTAAIVVLIFILLFYLGMELTLGIGLIVIVAIIVGPELDWEILFNKRIEIWTKAYLMWLEHPWFGLGTGNFQTQSEFIDDSGGIYNLGLHSMYAWMLFETGIVGSILFMAFIVCLLVTCSRVSRILRLLVIVMLISQITEFYLDHEEIFAMIFVAIIARISVVRREGDVEAA
jgi:O-antigen ligase